MSVPDHLLDEPDECLCEEHGQARPCKYCKFEHLMQRAEEYRERELFDECEDDDL